MNFRIVLVVPSHQATMRALIGPLPAECVGYHGTSAEAVIEAARTGFFPSRVGENADFFYMDARHPDARRTAAEYAAGNARLHAAQRFLGLPSVDALIELLDQDDEEAGGVLDTFAADGEAQGVLVGIGPAIDSLLVAPDLELGDVSEPGGLRAHAARGFADSLRGRNRGLGRPRS